MNFLKTLSVFSLFALGFSAQGAFAQYMSFEDYNPPSTLKVPENPVKRAKFPFVDIHSHQGGINEAKIDQLKPHHGGKVNNERSWIVVMPTCLELRKIYLTSQVK